MSPRGLSSPLHDAAIQVSSHSEPKELIDRLVELLRESELLGQDALPVLTHLSHALSERYDSEDDCGCYDDAILRAPWLTSAVLEVKERHGELLQRLEGIAYTLQHCGKTQRHPQDTHIRLSEFVNLFYEHEAAVFNLLQESCDQPAWTQE